MAHRRFTPRPTQTPSSAPSGPSHCQRSAVTIAAAITRCLRMSSISLSPASRPCDFIVPPCLRSVNACTRAPWASCWPAAPKSETQSPAQRAATKAAWLRRCSVLCSVLTRSQSQSQSHTHTNTHTHTTISSPCRPNHHIDSRPLARSLPDSRRQIRPLPSAAIARSISWSTCQHSLLSLFSPASEYDGNEHAAHCPSRILTRL